MTIPVLLIDDDRRLGVLLTEYLARFGFAVDVATHPEDGLRALKNTQPEILILDVMLPDMDGFAVCRRVRETSSVPIIMLTARGDVMDRIVGLELGADDYLPKPFEPRELVARIQAVLRRRAPVAENEVLRAGPLEVDLTTRTARLNGNDLTLTTAELELLVLLVRSRGRVLTRDRILEETRGLDWESFDRSIDVLVSRLRQKLGDDPKKPSFIRTVRGTGYSFIGGGGA
jgi:DNA-binding response OmpR family regulator